MKAKFYCYLNDWSFPLGFEVWGNHFNVKLFCFCLTIMRK